jgi:hypothetical protein
MGNSRDASEYFGLSFQTGGEMDPAGMVTQKKPEKSNKTISPQAEKAQKLNTTNRSRKTGASNG